MDRAELERILQQKNLELAIIEEFIYVLTTCEGHRDILNTARSIWGMLGAKNVSILWNEYRIQQELNLSVSDLAQLQDVVKKDSELWLVMRFRNRPFGVIRVVPYDMDMLSDEEKITVFKIVANALSLSIGALLEEDKLKATQKLSSIFGREALRDFFEKQLARAQIFDLPIGVIKFRVEGLEKITAACGYACREKFMSHLLRMIEYNLRSVDIIRRYDKESFLAILPGFDELSLTELAANLGKEVQREVDEFCQHNSLPSARVLLEQLCYPNDKEEILKIFKGTSN